MAKAEFLMLAHDFDSAKHYIYSWYMSEKLDGIRAFWDGGVSRGLSCTCVPWANTEKHDRYVTPPLATGLWTRYGQPIQAPGWWIDKLPKNQCLDGEMTMGRGTFQDVSSALRCLIPDARWTKIKYCVFDIPTYGEFTQTRRVNCVNFKKALNNCYQWVSQRLGEAANQGSTPYYARLHQLLTYENDVINPLTQKQLPSSRADLDRVLVESLELVLAQGGEGLILRAPTSQWIPERVYTLLKVKAVQDAEATVVGYRWGKATDIEKSISGEATDRLLGKMGSLRVQLDSGVVFDLASGFNLPERAMTDEDEGDSLQGKLAVNSVNPLFPIGSRITFQYRELTKDGVPKEARYWRKYED